MSWVFRGAVLLFVATMIASPVSTRAAGPDDELPDGDGKKILQAQCTACHDLSEVTKFRGYYDKAKWRDIVITMVEYGADLKKSEVDTLVDYLAENLGKK
jgi:hypothetical protein